MAACLLCGSRRARVLGSKTHRFERIVHGVHVWVRECWRVTQCPKPPLGCGLRDDQTIISRGATNLWKPRPPT